MSLGTSECIIYGKVKEVIPGRATMSLPPQCTCDLVLEGAHGVRGITGPVARTQFFYVGDACPVASGKIYVMGGDAEEGGFMKCAKEVASLDAARKEAEDFASAPYGWEGKVSPFTARWPGSTAGATVVCSKTGRPSYAIPSTVSFQVDQVIPPDVNENTNPFGNGEFLVTVTNKGSADVTVPVVMTANGPDFEQSLVLSTRDDFPDAPFEVCVFPENLPKDAHMAVLKPGQSLKGTVNTLKLKLKEVQWPCGGSRVYFTFGLGNAAQKNFFYYYSNIHDPLREAAQK